MQLQIDQSGKVEDTAKLTIVAYANGIEKTLKISGVEKRKLIRTMRMLDYPKTTFIYKAFAGLVFLLVKNAKADEIFIDKEYPRHEPTIKEILLQLFQKHAMSLPEISFSLIGKQSRAHKIAIETFRGARKPDLIIKAEEVLQLFYKANKKGWSSRSG